MKHKLIRDSVFIASTVLLISGLIKLLPNQKPQLFLIAGTLGLTGTTLIKKEEKPEQDITIKIKQKLVELIEQKTSTLEQELKQVNDSSNLIQQDLIDLVDGELQRSTLEIDDRVISLEQKTKKLIEESINQANKENQSARDKLKANLEKKNAQFKSPTNLQQSAATSLEIIELLKLQGVEVEANSLEYNPEQNQLASNIAKNYNCLQDFYRQLIKQVKNNQAFEYCLKDKHNEDIIFHTSLGAELKKLGFYPGYKYQGKNVKTMSFPACQEQVEKKLFNFLQGGWFEVHILAQTIKYLTKKNANNKNKKREPIEYNFLLNPYASFYRKNDNKLYRKHELDILVLIENYLVWIECKSGKVLDDELQKYSDNNQQFLRIPKRNALVVCFKISDSDAALKTKQYPGITVINPDSLVKSLENILNSKPIPLPALSTVEIANTQSEDNALTTIEVQPSKPIPKEALEVSASTINKPQTVKQSLTV